MPTPTPELGLQQALDSDDTADYLDTSLAQSLVTLDSLFNNSSGHTHGGVHQGGPINSIPASAIPDGSITSAKISDGTIATVDLADGCVTASKLGTGSVTSPAIAASVTLETPILNTATLNSPQMSNATITNMVIGGTINGGTWQYGPTTVDWFRIDTLRQGIFNNKAACGIGFDTTGPFIYGGPTGGSNVVSEAATQTLTNKTINGATLNGGAVNSMYLSNCSLAAHVGGAPIWDAAQAFPAGTKIANQNALTSHSSVDWVVDGGTIFFNSVPNGGQVQQATNFQGAFSVAPYVVCQIRDNSGGTNVQTIGIEARGIGTNGFYAVIDNRSGGTQSVSVDWIAFGH